MDIRSYIIKCNQYLLITIACCLLCRCSDDKDVVLSGVHEGSTYITLLWKQTEEKRAMRTIPDPGIPGSLDESMITNATILFFDKNHNIVKDVTANNITWHFDESGSYGYTDPIRLKERMPFGDYWVYVIANVPSSIDLSGIATLEDFTGTYGSFTPENVNDFFEPEKFLMVNQHDEITTGKTDGGIFLTTQPHQEQGTYENPIKVTVTLERLAAKVTLSEKFPAKYSIDGTPLKGGNSIDKIDIDGFTLINCVNQFNLIQQWEQGGSFTSTPRDMLLISPSSNTRSLYPIDESGYYNRISDPVSFKDIATPLYCLENNSPYYKELGITDRNALPKTKMKGRATAVMIKAHATLSDDGSGNTFYRYRRILYRDLAILRQEYPDITTEDDIASLRSKGVEVFENGNMYFIYWIKDTNYTDDGDNYYAVMRNTWYQLGIADIIDIGSDVPGGKDYDETDPVDQQAALVVSLKVNAWKIMPENEHILGEDDVSE